MNNDKPCDVCGRKSEKYNGWPNYETWAAALWIDNEQSSYEYWRAQARIIRPGYCLGAGLSRANADGLGDVQTGGPIEK